MKNISRGGFGELLVNLAYAVDSLLADGGFEVKFVGGLRTR